jgi:hypothetical protein
MDLVIKAPVNGKTEEIWIDAVGHHPLAVSSLKATAAFAHKALDSEIRCLAVMTPDPMKLVSTPSVLSRQARKHDTYRHLQAATLSAHVTERRSTMPTLFAAIVTHEGELSPEAFAAIHWITSRFRERLDREPASLNAIPKARLSAQFGTRLKGRIMAAAVNGFGDMLLCGGHFFAGGRRQRGW